MVWAKKKMMLWHTINDIFTHVLPYSEVLHDSRIFYVSYEKMKINLDSGRLWRYVAIIVENIYIPANVMPIPS